METASRNLIANRINWPKGYCCPVCKSPLNDEPRSRGRITCRHNGKGKPWEETLTKGTLLEAAKRLFNWVLATWCESRAEIPETAPTLEMRAGLSREASQRVLRVLQTAMQRINRDLPDLEPQSKREIEAMAPLAEGVEIIIFTLYEMPLESCGSRRKAKAKGEMERWVTGRIGEATTPKIQHVTSSRASDNLITRWKTYLARFKTPPQRGDLPLLVAEFVFFENHRAVLAREQVFEKLVQALAAKPDYYPRVVPGTGRGFPTTPRVKPSEGCR